MRFENKKEGYFVFISSSPDRSCASITIKSEVDELTHEDIIHILGEFCFYFEDSKEDLILDAQLESSKIN